MCVQKQDFYISLLRAWGHPVWVYRERSLVTLHWDSPWFCPCSLSLCWFCFVAFHSNKLYDFLKNQERRVWLLVQFSVQFSHSFMSAFPHFSSRAVHCPLKAKQGMQKGRKKLPFICICTLTFICLQIEKLIMTMKKREEKISTLNENLLSSDSSYVYRP